MIKKEKTVAELKKELRKSKLKIRSYKKLIKVYKKHFGSAQMAMNMDFLKAFNPVAMKNEFNKRELLNIN